MNHASQNAGTLQFIGVTTARSSIMKVFPEWAKHLGLQGASISGMDFALHDEPERYREAVRSIRSDPDTAGALVTTHKLDLFAACRDMFDDIDDLAELMSEVSCLSKRGGKLSCFAKDPAASECALDELLPARHFAETRADAFCIGAGGSAAAITWNLARKKRGEDRPARLFVSDRSLPRLEKIKALHKRIGSGVPVHCVHAPRPSANDRVLGRLKPASLVVNATGLGKDAPGSPITARAAFPVSGIGWDLNYRGALEFLDQVRRQTDSRGVRAVDGWGYFVHGWAQAICEVYGVDLPASGPRFNAFASVAARVAGRE